MSRLRFGLAGFVLACAMLCGSTAFGLGADHPPGRVGNSTWSDELTELINRPNRIHGYFVNWTDVLFYAGDAKELNAFLVEYAKTPNAAPTVHFSAGKGTAASPWKNKREPTVCDWKLTANGNHPALQVWIGGKVKLADVVVPKTLKVEELPTILEVLSGSDYDLQARAIREFAEKHNKDARTEAKAKDVKETPTLETPAKPDEKASPDGREGATAIDAEQPFGIGGRVSPQISANNKYATLLRVVPAPADEATYGKQYDYGYSQTTEWAGQKNLPAGYWVYTAPNWYIWQSVAAKANVAAADAMMNQQVTVWLDNGTPVAGQMVENTAEYVVLHQAAEGKKKLIYKAKITSIDFPATTAAVPVVPFGGAPLLDGLELKAGTRPRPPRW
jgi:sRNA-binding regulator protein Hfq